MPQNQNIPRFQPTSFGTYGNKARPPVHLKPAPGTPLNPDIFPVSEIDTSFDRNEIVQNAEIPEVSPVFSGLRRYITEIRVDRAQTKLETLSERQDVVRAIGESIIKGVGYLKPNNPKRPITFMEKRGMRKLEATTEKRRGRQALINHMADPNSSSINTDALTPPVRSTRRERLHYWNNRRHFRKMTQKNDGLDQDFAKVVGSSAQKAEKVLTKRNNLVVKSEALGQAKEIKERRKAERQQQKEAKKQREERLRKMDQEVPDDLLNQDQPPTWDDDL